jgi:hypothetical protein
MRFWGAAIFFAVSLFAGATSRPEAATPSKTLLDALRKATLERPLASIASIHISGNIEIVGIRGRIQEWDDLRGAARFTAAQNAGALSGASGWDGKVAWSQDYAGLVTVDGGAEGRMQAIDQAYLDTLRYLRPDVGGATVVYAGQRNSENVTYDVLAVTPPGGSELDLWLDPRTHLIARETTTFGIVSATTALSDYRHVDGVAYPFRASTQTSAGNDYTQQIASLELNTDVAERMRIPGQNVHDASIAGGNSATVPLQILNNHVYVSAMVNGRGPYTFIIDSGGDYIVTPEVVRALQTRSSGSFQLQGVGNATEGAGFTRLESIAVGGATVRNQYSLVLPIATGFGVSEGMRIDGMLGYQFLARFLTTIDYADSRLTLAMSGPQPAAAGAAAIKFYFSGTVPMLPITVDGVDTVAQLDTGNRLGLELTAPFLAAHPAIAALAKTQPGVTGFGVGGASYARLGRIPSLQIGPYQIANSVTSFGVATKGALADPFTPANVGGAVWRRFDLTFDYAHQQVLLAKNATFDTPAPTDRSGLFLIDQDGVYTVLSTMAGTPSATAGLVKGDTIVSVNGAAASSMTLAALRAVLAGSAGSVVRLHIKGPAGNERDVTLTLADYV